MAAREQVIVKHILLISNLQLLPEHNDYTLQRKNEQYNELIDLSQKIYEYAADTLTNYCAAKYCGVGNDTAEQQI